MNVLTTVFTIIQLLSCVFLIAVVLLQSGKSSGLSGAVSGNSAETFFSKGKSKSFDSMLARATKWVGIVFVVLTLAQSLVK